MSTAAPCWWARTIRHRQLAWALAFSLCGMSPVMLSGQTRPAAGMASSRQAHAVLTTTIEALGGPAWVGLRTSREHVRIATFFQGNPTGEVADAVISREHPKKERIDLDKGKVVRIYSNASGWEITYKGKKNLPVEAVEEHVRWQKHSLRRVLGRWLGDPATVVLDEGAEQVSRHTAEKLTLMHATDDAVTLDVDASTHLPVRLSFQWRDPHFHDRNIDTVEFDNYHRVDGIMTPFTVTRTHNGETVQQTFLLRVQYNIELPPNWFDPDYAAAHLK